MGVILLAATMMLPNDRVNNGRNHNNAQNNRAIVAVVVVIVGTIIIVVIIIIVRDDNASTILKTLGKKEKPLNFKSDSTGIATDRLGVVAICLPRGHRNPRHYQSIHPSVHPRIYISIEEKVNPEKSRLFRV